MLRHLPNLLVFLFFSCANPGGPAPAPDAPGNPGFSPDTCHYDPAPVRPAAPSSGPGTILAGVAEAPIDLPVGTPLGGYTARMSLLGGRAPDSRRTPWAHAFAPSVGVQSRPQARALYLQVGGEPLLLVKTDLCVAYDRLVYDLEKALAPDGHLRGKVIVAASHSHSAWATYQGVFHLALGFDLFQEAQYQRLLASLVQTAQAAMSAPVPARLGFGVWEGWDPADQIFSDRRTDQHNKLKGKDGKPIGPHKDGRLMVARVDDAMGQPLALLMNFPMHGTIADSDNPLASVDSTGHTELALEERFDRPVLVMHLQGPAGDASPRGIGTQGQPCSDAKDGLCTDYGRMESVGEIAAPRIYALWQAVQTTGQAEMEVISRAAPNGRPISVRNGMKYTPYDPNAVVDASPAAIYNPDGSVRSPITQFNVRVGAGLCGDVSSPLPVDGIDGAVGVPYQSCRDIEAAVKFVAPILKAPAPAMPECETTRTTFTAIRLSGVPVVRTAAGLGQTPVFTQRKEDLLLGTLPGEPVSLLADALRAASPAGPDHTFVIGYAQGHIGYILQVEDWLVGGYEPSINIYGPLEGEWLMERSLDLLRLAWSRQPVDPEAMPGGGRYDRLAFQAGTDKAAAPTPAADPGQPAASVPQNAILRLRTLPGDPQPPATVPRVSGRATFLFYGGDPAEDLPQVALQRLGRDSWEPVVRRSGRPVDNRGKEMILTYTPLPLDPGKPMHHLWAVEWQAVGWDRDADTAGVAGALSAPEGSYRFAVSGKANGKPYLLQSRPFQVVADGAVAVAAQRSAGHVSGQATYPVGLGYRLLRMDAPSTGVVPLWGTVSVRVQDSGGASVEAMVKLGADGKFDVQPATLDLSKGVTVTVTDAAGNTGAMMVP